MAPISLASRRITIKPAIALWADPVGAGDYLPFAPPSLSGRVLGSWAFLLGPLGALIAASRTFGDLDADGRALYVLVLVAWLAAALALVWASGERRPQPA